MYNKQVGDSVSFIISLLAFCLYGQVGRWWFFTVCCI